MLSEPKGDQGASHEQPLAVKAVGDRSHDAVNLISIELERHFKVDCTRTWKTS